MVSSGSLSPFPVVSVSIPALSLNPEPKPHHVFHILIAGPVRSWTVKKRYSDFHALFARLSSAFPDDAPPVSFPPKTASFGQAVSSLFGNSASEDRTFLESRREQLEAWLRAVIQTCPAWRDSLEVAEFLQIPERAGRSPVSTTSKGPPPASTPASPPTASLIGGPVATNNASSAGAPPPYSASPATTAANPSSPPPLDSRAWIDEHDRLRSLAREIRGIAANRPPPQSTSRTTYSSSVATNAPSPSDMHAHRMLAAYHAGLVRLEESLKSLQKGMREGPGARDGPGRNSVTLPAMQTLTPAELSRRYDLLDSLRSDLPALTRLASPPAASSNPNRPADATVRSQLLGDSNLTNSASPSASTASKRRFGADISALETNATRPVATESLVGLQTQMMRSQDESLAVLAGVVRRQREVAGTIGDELEVHNRLLGEMGGEVERTGGRLGKAGKRLDKVLGRK
ncbi:hypothetical protein HDU93_006026 [Gonapodya sp. JEL0774]|nr:hypothetical protein HDU93_006026 [Gonapodya sp. JEL0774]